MSWSGGRYRAGAVTIGPNRSSHSRSQPRTCSWGNATRPAAAGYTLGSKRRSRNALAVTSTVAPVSARIAIQSGVVPIKVVTRNTLLRPKGACKVVGGL